MGQTAPGHGRQIEKSNDRLWPCSRHERRKLSRDLFGSPWPGKRQNRSDCGYKIQWRRESARRTGNIFKRKTVPGRSPPRSKPRLGTRRKVDKKKRGFSG